MAKVIIKGKEFDLPIAEEAKVLAIQELTDQMKRLINISRNR